MTPRLTHVALHVRDLPACVAFYQDYCGLRITHERAARVGGVAWLAEPGRESDFVMVLIGDGPRHDQAEGDFTHLGYALESKAAVDAVAARAEAAGCLVWPARQEPYPVGYYCGVRDPDGTIVEFSYGQPLGPGAQGLAEVAAG